MGLFEKSEKFDIGPSPAISIIAEGDEDIEDEPPPGDDLPDDWDILDQQQKQQYFLKLQKGIQVQSKKNASRNILPQTPQKSQMLKEKIGVNVNRSSSKKQPSVSFIQDVHATYNKYKRKRVEGEALENLDEAPESDDIEVWEVVSVDVDHNLKEKIKSLTNLPMDENEHHDLGTIPIQSTPLMPASSSAKKTSAKNLKKLLLLVLVLVVVIIRSYSQIKW